MKTLQTLALSTLLCAPLVLLVAACKPAPQQAQTSGGGGGIAAPGASNPSQGPIPDTDAVGQIAGTPFRPDSVQLDLARGRLVFVEGEGDRPPRRLIVELFDRSLDAPLTITPASEGAVPQIHVWWVEGGQHRGTACPAGYALRLELSPASDGTREGRVALELPDGVATLAGRFSARLVGE